MTIETTQTPDERFVESMKKELYGRGYKDVEIIGGSAYYRRGGAYATTKDGQRVRLSLIVPNNVSIARHPHFRVKVVE